MTEKDRIKVIGHAMDHVAYMWARGLPVRHDRRDWTQEETELYNETYDRENKLAWERRHASGRFVKYEPKFKQTAAANLY